MDKWLEERCWIILVLIVVSLLFAAAARAVFASHMVRAYYLGSGLGSYCVMSSVDGDADGRVFCSDDINKILDVMTRANASLKR